LSYVLWSRTWTTSSIEIYSLCQSLLMLIAVDVVFSKFDSLWNMMVIILLCHHSNPSNCWRYTRMSFMWQVIPFAYAIEYLLSDDVHFLGNQKRIVYFIDNLRRPIIFLYSLYQRGHQVFENIDWKSLFESLMIVVHR
jgi:hypothetical protein